MNIPNLSFKTKLVYNVRTIPALLFTNAMKTPPLIDVSYKRNMQKQSLLVI